MGIGRMSDLSGLSKLPIEVRRNIYDHMLVDCIDTVKEGVFAGSQCEFESKVRPRSNSFAYEITRSRFDSISRTSKELREWSRAGRMQISFWGSIVKSDSYNQLNDAIVRSDWAKVFFCEPRNRESAFKKMHERFFSIDQEEPLERKGSFFNKYKVFYEEMCEKSSKKGAADFPINFSKKIHEKISIEIYKEMVCLLSSDSVNFEGSYIEKTRLLEDFWDVLDGKNLDFLPKVIALNVNNLAIISDDPTLNSDKVFIASKISKSLTIESTKADFLVLDSFTRLLGFVPEQKFEKYISQVIENTCKIPFNEKVYLSERILNVIYDISDLSAKEKNLEMFYNKIFFDMKNKKSLCLESDYQPGSENSYYPATSEVITQLLRVFLTMGDRKFHQNFERFFDFESPDLEEVADDLDAVSSGIVQRWLTEVEGETDDGT